ncbi:MAG: hypothetical protein GY827_08625 [Cytophagales bacterium]|nr:hypothetical protein [Cytophagales bacterium]
MKISITKLINYFLVPFSLYMYSCDSNDESETPVSQVHNNSEVYNSYNYYQQNQSSVTFFDNTNKLWAHRINKTDDIESALKNFYGVEIDVFYETDEKYFDVRHDGNPTGLSLEEYFESINNPEYHYYWLDFKNLSEGNSMASYTRLYEVLKKFDIMDNVIIEASSPEALGYYADKGIFTSYWIPWISSPSSTSNNMTAAKVQYYLDKYSFSVISADYRMYPFMKNYFPNYNKHTWVKNIDVPGGEEEAIIIAKEIAEDPTVKVILVNTSYNFLME